MRPDGPGHEEQTQHQCAEELEWMPGHRVDLPVLVYRTTINRQDAKEVSLGVLAVQWVVEFASRILCSNSRGVTTWMFGASCRAHQRAGR